MLTSFYSNYTLENEETGSLIKAQKQEKISILARLNMLYIYTLKILKSYWGSKT